MENNCEVEKLKSEIKKLNEKITELSTKNAVYLQDKYSAESQARDAVKEKDKLLSIIADLSKGIANLQNK